MEFNNSYKGYKAVPKYVSTEPPSTSHKLSEEQLQYYKENGFLVINRLIDFTDLYNYKEHFIRICKGLEPTANMTVVKDRSLMGKVNNKEDYINKLQDLQYDDVFMTYTEHPHILDVVAQLIGDNITIVNSMFINKPPGSSIHPTHQDLNYFPFRPADKIIGTWTAVDDVTVENGCLWVVPGTHRAGTLYRHTNQPGAMKLYHGIDDESLAPPDKRVHLVMNPGDTLFFHPLLIHGSGANTSRNYRRCMSVHYVNSDCYCVDVRGTDQDLIWRELAAEAKKRGIHDFDFAETWRLRSKEVRRQSKL